MHAIDRFFQCEDMLSLPWRLCLWLVVCAASKTLEGLSTADSDPLYPRCDIALIRSGGKGSLLSIAANLTDLPNRRWRDRLGLVLDIPIADRFQKALYQRLVDEAERLFCTPRVQTEWCLTRKHIPFLGGARALAHESIAENERLGAELDDLHLFLPGALGA